MDTPQPTPDAVASALGVLQQADRLAAQGDWRKAQELCATVAVTGPSAICTVARLDILICQYQLGFTAQIPERALPLLQTLPSTAWLACVGLVLLAARKNDELPAFRRVVLALANAGCEPFDLPTVPSFVSLQPDLRTCVVSESADGSLMSEIVQVCIDAGDWTDAEAGQLRSLADKYRQRAISMAVHTLDARPPDPPAAPPLVQPRASWWKRVRLFGE